MAESPSNISREISGGTQTESDKARAYRESVNKTIEDYIRSGTNLAKIAEIVGAEKYVIESKSVKTLDVKGFIEEQIKEKKYLRLPISFIIVDEVILPPSDGSFLKKKGRETPRPEEFIPRTRYLIEVLSNLEQSYSVVEGVTTENMVRRESYSVFILPETDKAVLVNDEPSNATFIVHDFSKISEGWRLFTRLTKDDLRHSQGTKVNCLYNEPEEKWKRDIVDLVVHGFKKPRPPKVELTNTEEISECEDPPTGWRSPTNLADELGLDHSTVLRRFKREAQAHPELFRRTARGWMYADPVLAEKIAADLKSRKEAPVGWETEPQIAKFANCDVDTVERITRMYKNKNPEWFAFFLDKANKLAEYVHPDLVKIIESELLSREFAPDGWMPKGRIARNMGVGSGKVEHIAERYRADHPEWFHVYMGSTKEPVEHYHRDLVSIIERVLQSIENVIPGWLTRQKVAELYSTTSKTVNKVIEPYRLSHPEWFRFFMTETGNSVEHVSNELVNEIKNDFMYENPPVGWETVNQVRIKLKKAATTVLKMSEPYKKTRPEWFGIFLDKTGKPAQYISPELITELEKGSE